jgi:hypothetical protein
MRPGSGIDRRTFLLAGAVGAAGVALGSWRLRPAAATGLPGAATST